MLAVFCCHMVTAYFDIARTFGMSVWVQMQTFVMAIECLESTLRWLMRR